MYSAHWGFLIIVIVTIVITLSVVLGRAPRSLISDTFAVTQNNTAIHSPDSSWTPTADRQLGGGGAPEEIQYIDRGSWRTDVGPAISGLVLSYNYSAVTNLSAVRFVQIDGDISNPDAQALFILSLSDVNNNKQGINSQQQGGTFLFDFSSFTLPLDLTVITTLSLSINAPPGESYLAEFQNLRST